MKTRVCVCVCVGGVQGATDERVCDVGRPAGPMNHWQKEREMIHTPNNPVNLDRSSHKSCAIDNEGYTSIPIFTLVPDQYCFF